MAKLKLSTWYTAGKGADARAAAKPSPAARLTGDPEMSGFKTGGDARAMLVRRACLYATWLATRDGLLDRPAHECAAFASINGQSITVQFTEGGRLVARVAIPAHIMSFDPEAPAIEATEPQDAHRKPAGVYTIPAAARRMVGPLTIAARSFAAFAG